MRGRETPLPALFDWNWMPFLVHSFIVIFNEWIISVLQIVVSILPVLPWILFIPAIVLNKQHWTLPFLSGLPTPEHSTDSHPDKQRERTTNKRKKTMYRLRRLNRQSEAGEVIRRHCTKRDKNNNMQWLGSSSMNACAEPYNVSMSRRCKFPSHLTYLWEFAWPSVKWWHDANAI